MSKIPEVGDPLTIENLDDILEAIQTRQEKFPGESSGMSIGFVFFNYGDRFTPVSCVNGEWEGHKQDLFGGEGIPLCPNGHVLTQGKGLRLGWIEGQ